MPVKHVSQGVSIKLKRHTNNNCNIKIKVKQNSYDYKYCRGYSGFLKNSEILELIGGGK